MKNWIEISIWWGTSNLWRIKIIRFAFIPWILCHIVLILWDTYQTTRWKLNVFPANFLKIGNFRRQIWRWRNKIPGINLYIFWKIFLLAFWISKKILPLTPRVVFSWSTKLSPVRGSRGSSFDTKMDLKHPEDELPWLSYVDFWTPRSKNLSRGDF